MSFFHRNVVDSIDDLKKILEVKALIGMPTGNQPVGFVSTRKYTPDGSDKDCLIDVVSTRTAECFVVYCTKTEVVLFSEWAEKNRIPLVNGINELIKSH